MAWARRMRPQRRVKAVYSKHPGLSLHGEGIGLLLRFKGTYLARPFC